MDVAARVAQYEEILRRFASGVRAGQLYSRDHPLVTRSVEGLLAALKPLLHGAPSLAVGIVGGQFVVADTPLPRASAAMGELIRRLKEQEIERIAFDRGITAEEALAFILAVGAAGARAPGEPWTFPHIRVGRITADERRNDGVASDMAAIRQLYSGAVTTARDVWESAAVEGRPELPAAVQAIDGLADAVSQNRTAVMALTAMRNYDNYTFTHMVNVSILTMGQARALGIEGRLLREFGLSALMHDIGKVRTPKEILNKPEKLTDEEFAIMRRHTVDGAEILRRTPEMPILAPVVAFEHHLRLDGSGYPLGVRRDALNLGTMLCSIADVYDAMRSQRGYQEAFATDRILAVLERNDGRQFDQHLVRRFVQLLGIYPAGTLVKLTTGEIAVVTGIHAPDPYRPRVRVIVGPDGTRLDLPQDRNLFETTAADAPAIVSPLDPAAYAIDPLAYLQDR
ncbi:MAG TPA: HD-GYP domain-containing protein [Vicinamibacterales bacterium]|nr:HD-GYP domain-containing protein [Vicinamibacterales bacterium]